MTPGDLIGGRILIRTEQECLKSSQENRDLKLIPDDILLSRSRRSLLLILHM